MGTQTEMSTIGLHDVYFASRIYDMLERESETIDFQKDKNKFWI